MILNDICEIRKDFMGADFWLKTDTIEKGKPTKTYHKGYIGVKVQREDILLPDYLFYLLTYQYSMGVFKNFDINTINDIQLTLTN